MKDVYIENKEQLVTYFREGEKDLTEFKIGTEHETFLFSKMTQERVPYEGKEGIHSVLQAFVNQGWLPNFEGETLISLHHAYSMKSISLEPGGQFELSGSPVKTLHEGDEELKTYLYQLDDILRNHNIQRVGVGFDPVSKQKNVPWMPKDRYKVMRKFMTRGHGLDMMTRTCTVQVNLDYINEQDMVEKFRVSMGLQPILSAMFATSSRVEGKESGYHSYRNYVWQHTDADRCGLLPFVFQDDMGYERYVDYLLDVPMYYIYRQHKMNLSGETFRTFLNRKLSIFPGEIPKIDDWINQISMVFPEVRLKQYLELRAADCGNDRMIMALPALWVGLLYNEENLRTCHDYVQSLPFSQIQDVYYSVPKYGLTTLLRQEPIGHLARSFLEKSAEGLRKRGNLNAQGQDESIYLDCLFDILDQQKF